MVEIITNLRESFTQMDLMVKSVFVFWLVCLIGFIVSLGMGIFHLIRNGIILNR